MSSTLQSIFSQDVLNNMTEWIKQFQKKTMDLWNSSKYFRIISVATSSIAVSLLIRNLYIRCSRKYYNMPPGPVGYPFLGEVKAMFDFEAWGTMAPINKYGPIATIHLGTMTVILISNPYLLKKIYSDPRTLDNPHDFISDDVFLTAANGEMWAKRRKIIFANIMSTMKGSFVEESTKKFIKNKLLSLIDDDIKNNKNIDMKQLFRCIGFNIVLHACFGKELESINDPFWSNYEGKMNELRKTQAFQLMVLFCFGNGKMGKKILDLFGMKPFEKGFEEITKIIEEFAVSDKHKVAVKYDENVKLYNEYIQQYDNDDDAKLTRRHLLGDMSIMMQASTDTTYMGLAYAVTAAAKNMDIQNEIFEELNTAYNGDINNIQLTNDGIFKIPKLRAFVHEVLRIYSPAPIAGFRDINVDDFKIDTNKFGGNGVYNVPKGTKLAMNVYSIGHEPKWWIKDYDPIKHKDFDMKQIHFEFWIDQNGKFNKRNNSDLFLTFSRGKRDCIGQSLAMKVLYIALSMIFMKYKIYGPNGDEHFEIKLTRENGLTVKPETIKMELR